MFQAQLILSGTQKERLNQAEKIIKKILGVSLTKGRGHPDLIVLIPSLSLGIAQIRDLQQKLALKPYSASKKVALITQAERLTFPAQNALLKTLEEPPKNTLIILLSPNKENLLPTIISRCQEIQLTQKPQIEPENQLISQHFNILISIFFSSAGERLNLAEQFKTRQKALTLTNNFLLLLREILLAEVGVKNKKIPKKIKFLKSFGIKNAIENTQIARIMLEANVNSRLIIENLFLSYPSAPKV